MRHLNNWLTSYLQLTKETEPPQRFHLWSAITILGALLGRKCTVRLGPEEYFPNLYTILIGPPGVRKGTAIKYATDLLKEVEPAVSAPDAITKEALCKEMEGAQKELLLDGGQIFVHSSLFVIAPELVVFIKENDHERLGYLCQLYDGLDKFEYKTKTSGHNYIVNPGLWILGATTPNWIEIAMKQLGVGGGMTSRTVYVFAARKGRHIPVTRMKAFDRELKSKLIEDLAKIKEMAGPFTVSKDADQLYSEWYEGEYTKTGVDDSRFASYWERLPSMVIKVAMIVSAAKREDKIVAAEDIALAIKMFEGIHPEMPKAFGALGYNVRGPQTEMVRNLIAERGTVQKSHILYTLRMHISEWDYTNIRNTLIAERFCSAVYDYDRKEEILTLCPKQCQLPPASAPTQLQPEETEPK